MAAHDHRSYIPSSAFPPSSLGEGGEDRPLSLIPPASSLPKKGLKERRMKVAKFGAVLQSPEPLERSISSTVPHNPSTPGGDDEDATSSLIVSNSISTLPNSSMINSLSSMPLTSSPSSSFKTPSAPSPAPMPTSSTTTTSPAKEDSPALSLSVRLEPLAAAAAPSDLDANSNISSAPVSDVALPQVPSTAFASAPASASSLLPSPHQHHTPAPPPPPPPPPLPLTIPLPPPPIIFPVPGGGDFTTLVAQVQEDVTSPGAIQCFVSPPLPSSNTPTPASSVMTHATHFYVSPSSTSSTTATHFYASPTSSRSSSMPGSPSTYTSASTSMVSCTTSPTCPPSPCATLVSSMHGSSSTSAGGGSGSMRPCLTLNLDALGTPIPSPADERGEYISAEALRNWNEGGGSYESGLGGEGEQGIDMFFEEGEELGPLEKIYLFSRSRAVFHRVYISRTLAKFLPLITPHEAVEYVLPLLNGLGTDQDDSVREAFVSELVPIMWWFFVNCEVIDSEDVQDEEQAGVTNADPSASSSDDTPSPRPKLHVQTFTPLLGSLLLSVNPSIGDAARWGIVELLARLRESPEAVTDARSRALSSTFHSFASSSSAGSGGWSVVKELEAGPVSWGGMPSSKERRIIERELVFGVVIGMARLDWEHDQGEFGGEAGPVAGEGRDGDDDETERWSSTWGSAAGSVADLPPIASEGQDNTLGHSGAAESSPSALSAVSWTTVESTPSLSLSVQTAPSSDDIVSPGPFSSSDGVGLGGEAKALVSGEDFSGAASSMGFLSLTLPSFSSLRSTVSLEDGQQSSGAIGRMHQRQQLPCPQSPATSSLTLNANRPPSPDSNAGAPTAPTTVNRNEVPYDPEDDQAEEAAVGRVASMSLIAAVTASVGPLNDDVTPAFLEEVERVGSDPVHWVRREAAYALGALAKVISDEEVIHSLFPLYNSFISDRKWRVRYSALFALPGLLSRLAITERRSYAISQLTTLTHDVSRSVRLGTLEILGEVIHTFCDDQDGLPSELIDLFMGKVKAIGAAPNVGGSTTGMRRPPFRHMDTITPSSFQQMSNSGLRSAPFLGADLQTPDRGDGGGEESSDAEPDFPNDTDGEGDEEMMGIPARGEGTHFEKNLIRAFSFPAVALTLGRDRWGELKAFYAQLAGAAQTGTDKPSAGSVNAKVRKTLAASIGEMAKIVGSKAAVEDLVPVLYGLLRHGSGNNPGMGGITEGSSGWTEREEEEEIKIKAIESLDVFLEAIDETERGPIGRELERMWAGEDFDRMSQQGRRTGGEGGLPLAPSSSSKSRGESGFGWRVRDAFSRKLGVLSGILRKEGNVVRSLVMKALVDPVAAIRESAVDFLPTCIQNLGVSTVAAKRLRADVESFAIADTSKRRTTFVYCIQALALSQALGPLEISKGSFWKVLRGLAQDPVIDVRIAVSRLVSLVCYKHFTHGYPPTISYLIRLLGSDSSEEVRSFVYCLNFPPSTKSPHTFSSSSPPTLSLSSSNIQPPETFLSPPPIINPVPAAPSTPFATFSKPPFFTPDVELTPRLEIPRATEAEVDYITAVAVSLDQKQSALVNGPALTRPPAKLEEDQLPPPPLSSPEETTLGVEVVKVGSADNPLSRSSWLSSPPPPSAVETVQVSQVSNGEPPSRTRSERPRFVRAKTTPS